MQKSTAAGRTFTAKGVATRTRIIAAASVAGKQPTGLQAMVELSKLLSSEQGKLIDSATRLGIVQQLGQQRMQATGIAASLRHLSSRVLTNLHLHIKRIRMNKIFNYF